MTNEHRASVKAPIDYHRSSGKAFVLRASPLKALGAKEVTHRWRMHKVLRSMALIPSPLHESSSSALIVLPFVPLLRQSLQQMALSLLTNGTGPQSKSLYWGVHALRCRVNGRQWALLLLLHLVTIPLR